ncbi:MAG: hypothetical protein ABSB70_13045 [Candidatus Velthaea sp.]
MRFILVMQHELDGRARYLVAVDHEDAFVFQGARNLNSDLHTKPSRSR